MIVQLIAVASFHFLLITLRDGVRENFAHRNLHVAAKVEYTVIAS